MDSFSFHGFWSMRLVIYSRNCLQSDTSKIWYRKFRDQFRDNSESRWPTSMSVCKVRPAALWVGMLKNGYQPSSLQISHGKKPYTFTHPTRVAKYCAPNEQNVGRPLHLLTKLSEHLTCLDAKPNSKYVHWYVLALCASTTRYSKKIDGEWIRSINHLSFLVSGKPLIF